MFSRRLTQLAARQWVEKTMLCKRRCDMHAELYPLPLHIRHSQQWCCCGRSLIFFCKHADAITSKCHRRLEKTSKIITCWVTSCTAAATAATAACRPAS